MGTTPTEVLAFPNIKAIVRDNGTAEVVVAGNSRVVPDGDTLQDLRNNALALVVGEAKTLQRPVRVQIEDPEGHGELIVHPDNKIESVSYEPRPARRRAQAPETTPETVAPAVIESVPVAAPGTDPCSRSARDRRTDGSGSGPSAVAAHSRGSRSKRRRPGRV